MVKKLVAGLGNTATAFSRLRASSSLSGTAVSVTTSVAAFVTNESMAEYELVAIILFAESFAATRNWYLVLAARLIRFSESLLPTVLILVQVVTPFLRMSLAHQHNDARTIEELQQEITSLQMKYTDVSDAYAKLKPSYFNSGCCCFDNGGITGIEISGGVLRLIQWKSNETNTTPERIVLEERPLQDLLEALHKA